MESTIPEELLAPLGKVIANFGVLEESLSSIIWLLLFGNSVEEQRTGQIVTAELYFKDKIKLFSSLYQHRFPDEGPFDELNEMRIKLRNANEQRNSLLHSTWAHPGVRLATTAKEKKGIKFEFEEMGQEQIKEIADSIASVSKDLLDMSIAILKKL